MEYAITDIETTGGSPINGGVTEVAIILFDGEKIIGRYETLINPQRTIPGYITALTGISDAMAATAPTFNEVAGKIFNLLNGRIFVAHNVNFDYSFLKHHLSLAGYDWHADKLCTVRMSRKIVPGLHSYSLGNLCRELDIPLNNRHRAGGDANATVVLLQKLLLWDEKKYISEMLKKSFGEQQLPPNLPKEDMDSLPHLPGVYYFKDEKEKVIYVGKAKDLQKRVKSHFTGHNPNPQRQHFLRRIHHIVYEVCATELMAFILEAIEIKRLWPEYNRVLKKYEPKFGLFVYEGLDGFTRLAIGKFNKHQLPVTTFHRAQEGINLLHNLSKEYGLCKQLCGIGDCAHGKDECNLHEGITEYNRKVTEAIENYLSDLPSYFIFSHGRNNNEQSVIWIEKGKFYGMGYVSRFADTNDTLLIKNCLKRYPSNHYIMQLISQFIGKIDFPSPHAEIVYFTEDKREAVDKNFHL